LHTELLGRFQKRRLKLCIVINVKYEYDVQEIFAS
jgi:hypothetical protein